MPVSKGRYWDLLVTYLRPHRRRVIVLAATLLGSIGLQLASPLLMRTFLDAATSGGALDWLVTLAGSVFVLALAQQLLVVITAYLGEDLGWAATNQLRYDLARRCLGLDLSYHNAHSPGELIERIDGDATALSNFFSQFLIQIVGNALLLLGVLALMLAEDWRVGLALVSFVAATMLVISRVRTMGVPYWKAARQASGELYGFIEERLGGTEDIRASGARPSVMRRSHELMRVAGRSELVAGLMSSIMVNATWLLFAIGNAMAFVVSALLFERGELTIGTAYLIFFYTNLLTRPMERIMQQLEDMQRAVASVGRVDALLQLRSQLADGHGAPLPSGPLAVELNGVSFGYDDEGESQPGRGRGEAPCAAEDGLVLRDITLRLAPGTVLGVLGRTGSGKTTLARLLVRLYDPTCGSVRLGGADCRDLRLPELRSRVGVVTQNVQLFHATIRDNLTFFDAGVPDERVSGVLRSMGLGAWLDSLPQGLDTVLAAGGGGLSAGEAQLLAFARVFLQNPGLVILDEASSRLDPATEQVLERAVGELVRGRTAVIIAHRLRTVERTDEILILDRGRVEEHGARAQLSADPRSRFARLLKTGLEEVLA